MTAVVCSLVSVAAAQVGRSFARPFCCPALSGRGRKRRTEPVKLTMPSVAKPHRSFEHCIEHRGKVTGRGIDDPQNLGGRGLLSERFVALGRRLIQVPLRFGKFSLTLGKLTFEVGYPLIGIG